MDKLNVVDTLVKNLSKLPGIGEKTAQRLAFYIMKMERNEALSLASAIVDVKEKVVHCSKCFNLTEEDPCGICSDPKRDTSIICVVESPADVSAVEKAGIYRGVYHVLGGVLSPLDNVGPDDIHVHELYERLSDEIREVIIATNPTVEGEATSIYLADILTEKGIRVTRIAMGLPIGSDLELADKVTLARSFEGRLNVK